MRQNENREEWAGIRVQRNVIMRVKAGALATRLLNLCDNLPEFMSEEKSLLIKEIRTLEGQVNAVRQNCYLRDLVDNYLPRLRKTVQMLKTQLSLSTNDGEKGQVLLKNLREEFPKYMSLDKTLLAAEFICRFDVPEDEIAAAIFDTIFTLTTEMIEINKKRAAEDARLSTIGRCKETKAVILNILERILNVAKGFAYRLSTSDEAIEVLWGIADLCSGLRRNLPRKRRSRAETEVSKTDETKITSDHIPVLTGETHTKATKPKITPPNSEERRREQ